MRLLEKMTSAQRNIAFHSILTGLLLLVLLSANTALAATFKTVNGEVVIEAEQYTRLGGSVGGTWFVNTAKSGFKGSGYIEAATNDPTTLSYSSNIIRAEYEIDFKTTGRYYVHLRTYAGGHTENGFFATLNGSPVDYGNPNAFYIWVRQSENPFFRWYTDGGGAEQRGFHVSVNITSTGKKTFAVYRRDKGTRIDRIWLTKNQSDFQDTAEIDRPAPSTFIVTGGGGTIPSTETSCSDGVDNDQDGRTDCADSDCAGASNCNTSATETNCNDGVDNDKDGRTDCADSDCSGASNCNTPATETNCNDGVDNDQDGRTDCADSDCSGASNCNTPATETNCNDGVDNDKDGFTDCADTNCIGVGSCESGLLHGSFDSGQDGFTYSDDTFRGTNNPAYATGDYISNGGYSGGALQIVLGGVPGIVSDGISGGWSRNFTMNTSGTARVVLSYRMITDKYDANECGQVLVAVDGNLIGFGQEDYVDELCGRGETGWQQVTLDVNLSAGNHTLTVGGYNNEKTGPLEETEIFIDDIIVTQLDGGSGGGNPPQPPVNGFTYADDTFRGTSNGKYASGSAEGDTLKVLLGEIPGVVSDGMSGGWSTDFSMNTSGTAQVVFSYRMITHNYDANECGQVLVAVDGDLIGFGQEDYVDELCGRGETGWQQVTLNVNLSAGNHTLTVGGYNNEKTGPLEATEIFLREIQITEQNQQDPVGSYDGFSYGDDAFRNTRNATYATGDVAGGALQVLLGGVDTKNIINGISGGWSKQFSTSSNGNVSITFNYRLMTERYDDDECGQALVSVDGTLIGANNQDYLYQICGIGDTGWRNETLNVYLSAGNHTLTVGGYNNKKTAPLEITEVLFDNVDITP